MRVKVTVELEIDVEMIDDAYIVDDVLDNGNFQDAINGFDEERDVEVISAIRTAVEALP